MLVHGTETLQGEALASISTVGVQLLLIVTGFVLIICCIKIVKQVMTSLPSE